MSIGNQAIGLGSLGKRQQQKKETICQKKFGIENFNSRSTF